MKKVEFPVIDRAKFLEIKEILPCTVGNCTRNSKFPEARNTGHPGFFTVVPIIFLETVQ